MEYKVSIIAKVESLRGDEGGVFSRAGDVIEEVRARISRKRPDQGMPDSAPHGIAKAEKLPTPPLIARLQPPAAPAEALNLQPVPVEIVDELSAQQIAQGILGPIISPLATVAIVIVFAVFILIERENLRNRIIHLVGSQQLNVTTQALDDAAF